MRAIIYCANRSKCQHKGIFIPIDIDRIIDHVHVAPYAEDWIVNLIRDLLKKFNLNVPVSKSQLYDSRHALGV